MKRGRCHGCGRRDLLVSFRGDRCLTCVLMASEQRGEDQEWYGAGGSVSRGIEPEGRHPKPQGSGVSPATVKTGRARGCGIMTAERIAEVLQMRARGMSLEAIGRQIGVSPSYVSRFVPRTRPWTRRGGKVAA
jgi:hypothetical protein